MFKRKNDLKKSKMNSDAKRKQKAAIIDYYVKKREEENKRGSNKIK